MTFLTKTILATTASLGVSAAAASSCSDVGNWYDSFGPSYNCALYAKNAKNSCVDSNRDGNFGLTAAKACCARGGGFANSEPPLTTATGWQFFSHQISQHHWKWDVTAVELYSTEGCEPDSRISTTGATFSDSGNADPSDSYFGPQQPFEMKYPGTWGGRYDENGSFYFAIEFGTPQTVRCVKLKQNGDGGSVENLMILARTTPSDTYTNVWYATGLKEADWNIISIASNGAVPTTPTTSTMASTTAKQTTSASSSSRNPIEVPSHLVPVVPGANRFTTQALCRYVDLSTVSPSANPGYQDESMGGETLTGDDMWETAFYMMLYTNCERQARGLSPFAMWSNHLMLQMQPTYQFQGGHDGFDDRANLVGGKAAEGAGGAQFPGSCMPKEHAKEDTIINKHWDPLESGRRSASGLVDHGDSMRDPGFTCVWAGVTIGPTADNYLNTALMYGDSC